MSDFTLYYTPTSCGAANFIVASLGGLEFDSDQVNIGPAKKTASGKDFMAINPKGSVPAIVTSDGVMLSENMSCLPYLADKNPKSGLAPARGTPERYVFLDKLAHVNASMHKPFAAMFGPGASAEVKEKAIAAFTKAAKYFTDEILKDQEYACGGSSPSAVDIYAYIVFSWTAFVGIDLATVNPKAAAFFAKIKALPGVIAAHQKMAAAPSAK